MYDELVKRLREQVKCDKKLYPQGAPFETLLLDLAADAIEELSYKYQRAIDDLVKQEKPKWVQVTERLPEESWERVLAYTDDGTVMTLPAIKLRNGYVRYWMPLPEPPKEE